MRFGPSNSVSSKCLDPRRGGGDSDVIPASSSGSGGTWLRFIDRDGRLGMCICREVGSFWSKVIFSPIGVVGGKIDETTSIELREDELGMSCNGPAEGNGALSILRRCLIDDGRLTGGSCGEDSKSTGGVGGKGPAGGGKGLVLLIGDPGIGSSIVE